MGVIQDVHSDRVDLARVLKKHAGIRRIVEDLYPDSAHFIYELLQNAEDTGAKSVSFVLNETGLVFEHDGRPFSPRDIEAITDIGEGTKAEDDDKIGRFGVGFKAVFAYSDTPLIWSKTYSFQITDLVLPVEIPPDDLIGNMTRFNFPFNNPKKAQDLAYKEVLAGLEELAETTLLFLSHIESIKWAVDGGRTGEVLRLKHSERHFEVLKRQNDAAVTSLHFLKFDQPLAGIERQRVAVAYALDLLPNIGSFDSRLALAKQMKIVSANPGTVAVFFPAEKEASGLRFHLHGPFVPELSRASIKETPANQPLFEQIAALAAASLDEIRDIGLLTVEFLGVLPNPHDVLPRRYAPIRAAIVDAMKTRPLTPTYAKSHAPGRHLIQGKASLKELLTADDIEFLVDYNEVIPQWAATAPQKNGAPDRFLSAIGITEWDIEQFADALVEKSSNNFRTTNDGGERIYGPDPTFMAWLSEKDMQWHQDMYALLSSDYLGNAGWQKASFTDALKSARIVRLRSGAYGYGPTSFFSTDGGEDDDNFPRVEPASYDVGRSNVKRDNATDFLREIGVREIGEVERIEGVLRERYSRKQFRPDVKDIARFVEAFIGNPRIARMFADYFIFKVANGKWRKPGGVFIDHPFRDTALKAYYEALGATEGRQALAEDYATCGVETENLIKFAEAAGCQTALSVMRQNTSTHPQSSELRKDWLRPGVRWTSTFIDEDWVIPHLSEIVGQKSERLSLLIWKTMCAAGDDVLASQFRPNRQYETKIASSSLVLTLEEAEWIPQGEGKFVKPCLASRDFLPEGFTYDVGWKWLKAVKFGVDNVRKLDPEFQRRFDIKYHGEKLGFADPASVERAQRFASLPVEEQERFLEAFERNVSAELPEHEPSNPARRAERVSAQAVDAPERRTEERTRSVSIARDDVKTLAAPYLRSQYTNSEGAMICQICKKEMPFKLPNGEWYFEKVEFLPGLRKHHHQNYLALCPNHAAMFQHACGSDDIIAEMFEQLDGNKLEVVLAENDEVIYFTSTHIADLKAVISAESDEKRRTYIGSTIPDDT